MNDINYKQEALCFHRNTISVLPHKNGKKRKKSNIRRFIRETTQFKQKIPYFRKLYGVEDSLLSNVIISKSLSLCFPSFIWTSDIIEMLDRTIQAYKPGWWRCESRNRCGWGDIGGGGGGGRERERGEIAVSLGGPITSG